MLILYNPTSKAVVEMDMINHADRPKINMFLLENLHSQQGIVQIQMHNLWTRGHVSVLCSSSIKLQMNSSCV